MRQQEVQRKWLKIFSLSLHHKLKLASSGIRARNFLGKFMETKNYHFKEEKTVYFVRHGESRDNILPVFQDVNSPLSDHGRAQASKVAERIAKIDFDTLIVSPLPRARETAEAITKLTGKIPEYSELFVERIKPKNINGKPHTDEEAHKLSLLWDESLHTPGIKVEDGENFDEIFARADKALEYLANRPEKNMVVVTHGFFLRALVAKVMLGGSLTRDNFQNIKKNTKTQNTGISVMKYVNSKEGFHWKLWVFNDHAHLG
ncbi:histidine phosphatase family protein [Candidatus Parcubacteria bacterium]|nr:histidine phosphatase family protein [Candidatus Parcubacteria bacterium]